MSTSVQFHVNTDGVDGPGLIVIDAETDLSVTASAAETTMFLFEEFHARHNQKDHGRRGNRRAEPNISETPGEVGARLKKQIEGFDLPAGHKITDVSTRGGLMGGFDIDGRIVNSQGENVGAFNRIIQNTGPDQFLYNDSLFINPSSQALGVGSKFADQFEAMVKEEFGITEHRLYAMEVGKYAWAKRGYEPIGDEALEIGDTWVRHMKNHGEITSRQREDLEGLETQWEFGVPVRPYDLFAINKEAATNAMFDSPSWEGRRNIG